MREITHLSKAQLGHILKETQIDARKKMIVAWCKENGKVPPVINPNADEKKEMKRIDKGYPDWIAIPILAKHLNLPDLQQAVNDIRYNYLERTATRQYIIEYPQKKINETEAIPKRIRIPETLRSFLADNVASEIISIWKKRYGHLITPNGEAIQFE
jgi:hypothetical protein